MNIRKTNVINLLLALGGLLFSLHSQATCTLSNTYTGYASLRLGNYSTGVDFTSGGTIFRQKTNGVQYVSFRCNNGNATIHLSVQGGVPIAGTTDTYASGIPGVGIKFTSLGGIQLPYSRDQERPDNTLTVQDLGFYTVAVKTGPITAGTANGSLLPPITWTVTDNDGIPAVLSTTNWNPGGFTVNTPTCITPNYTFDLGAVNINGSAPNSNWLTTPIILTGCTAFYGNAVDNNSYNQTQATTTPLTSPGFTETGSRAKNIVTMTLSPQITAIDPANGILANQPGGGLYARGVGVQVGTLTGSTYSPLNLSSTLVAVPDLGSSLNITFPLAARIVKTGDVVNPGKILSTATYTITYK